MITVPTMSDLRDFRLRLSLTQEHLAHRLHVTVGTVSRWENGKNKPSPMAVRQLARMGFAPAPNGHGSEVDPSAHLTPD